MKIRPFSMRTALTLLGMAATFACSASAMASTVWDEAVQGEFSGNGLQPTPIVVAAGSNLVLGGTGDAGQGVDRDYFSFVVPPGHVLRALMLLPNTTISGGASFIAVQAGPQITALPTGEGAGNLLGYAHYGGDLIGTDLLALIASAGPLPAGAYSVWLQETGGPVEYGFDLQIAPVPEPRTWALMGSGLLVMARRRMQRRAAHAV